MKTRMALLVLFSAAVLAACSLSPKNESSDTSTIATAVAETQAAGAQASQNEDAADTVDYPAKAACVELEALIAQYVGMETVLGPGSFNDAESGVSGDGCQVTASTSADMLSDWGQKVAGLLSAFYSAGWEMDPNFSGAGATGELQTLRKDGMACTYVSEAGPEDPSLCNAQESIVACLERLDPSYVMLAISIGCTPDSYVPSTAESTPVDEGEPEQEEEPVDGTDEAIRISFAPGAISAYVNGTLPAISSQEYVLTAIAGQEMVVSLSMNPPLQGIITVHGEDGTVLISDHATTAFWYGTLPLSEDYYINVRSSPDYPISYSLQVIIPPLGDTYTDGYQALNWNTCQSLASLVGSITGVSTQIDTALFFDHISGEGGVGCNITAWGTFDMFVDRNAISSTLQSTLVANGWAEAYEYGAGGAGGFQTGYISGDTLCLYTEQVAEMDPWVCDDVDGPISLCWEGLDPTEMFYEITLNCATPN